MLERDKQSRYNLKNQVVYYKKLLTVSYMVSHKKEAKYSNFSGSPEKVRCIPFKK